MSTAESLKQKFSDLKLSEDEVNRFTEALKKEEFRKLLVEYANEISDPKNRQLYEEEITRLENERGVDVTFINPEAGFCLKTTQDGDKKCFINICKNENIKKPTSEITKRMENGVEKKGMTWQIPHSCAPPKEDIDKSGQKCVVYDVVFHPDAYRMAETNTRFKALIQDSAIETIEKNFKVKVDQKNIKQLKGIKFKGTPTATVIRKSTATTNDNEAAVPTSEPQEDLVNSLFKTPYKYPPEPVSPQSTTTTPKTNGNSSSNNAKAQNPDDIYETPKYSIINRGSLNIEDCVNELKMIVNSTRPKEIVVDIDLPLCKSASNVKLDIFEKQLKLESQKPNYKLDLKLPYPVDENEGQAKFDKTKRKLIVTLPVLPFKADVESFVVDDKPLVVETHLDTPPESPTTASQQLETESKVQETVAVAAQVEQEEKRIEPPTIKYTLPSNYKLKQNKEFIKIEINVENLNKKSTVISINSSNVFIKYETVGSGGYSTYYSANVNFENKEFIDLTTEYKLDYLNNDKTLEVCLKKSNKFIVDKATLSVNQIDTENAIVVDIESYEEEELKQELDKIKKESSELISDGQNKNVKFDIKCISNEKFVLHLSDYNQLDEDDDDDDGKQDDEGDEKNTCAETTSTRVANVVSAATSVKTADQETHDSTDSDNQKNDELSQSRDSFSSTKSDDSLSGKPKLKSILKKPRSYSEGEGYLHGDIESLSSTLSSSHGDSSNGSRENSLATLNETDSSSKKSVSFNQQIKKAVFKPGSAIIESKKPKTNKNRKRNMRRKRTVSEPSTKGERFRTTSESSDDGSRDGNLENSINSNSEEDLNFNNDDDDIDVDDDDDGDNGNEENNENENIIENDKQTTIADKKLNIKSGKKVVVIDDKTEDKENKNHDLNGNNKKSIDDSSSTKFNHLKDKIKEVSNNKSSSNDNKDTKSGFDMETMLSWKAQGGSNDLIETTKCAFKFANTIMNDLDD